MATKQGSHKQYGPKMSDPRFAKSREHRGRGPLGLFIAAMNAAKGNLHYVRPVTKDELERAKILRFFAAKITVRFFDNKTAKMAGSMAEVWEGEFEKLSKKTQKQIATEMDDN